MFKRNKCAIFNKTEPSVPLFNRELESLLDSFRLKTVTIEEKNLKYCGFQDSKEGMRIVNSILSELIKKNRLAKKKYIGNNIFTLQDFTRYSSKFKDAAMSELEQTFDCSFLSDYGRKNLRAAHQFLILINEAFMPEARMLEKIIYRIYKADETFCKKTSKEVLKDAV